MYMNPWKLAEEDPDTFDFTWNHVMHDYNEEMLGIVPTEDPKAPQGLFDQTDQA